MSRMPLGDLRVFLENHLNQSIVPFWLKHAIDPQGGINSCISDDGVILSYDKYMWSQLRAIWTFSALYNRIEKKQQYLGIARQIAAFAIKHGRDDQQRWVFAVTREGKPLIGHTSIYAGGFAILGFSELYRATGDRQYLEVALDTARRDRDRINSGESLPIAPYEIPPGLKTHGVSMMYSLAFQELAKDTGDPMWADEALKHAREVMDLYLQKDRKALVEYIKLDGSFDDSPPGRAVVPGHAIESMWFQIHQFEHLDMRDQSLRAIEAMRWHMELGWDKEYGGLFLGLDLDGKEPPYWKFADTKLWWPQTEALYGLLLAYSISREEWCLDWYWKMHEVAFKHYPVKEHGEWTQRLDRQFQPLKSVVALPVKDPFHLPRVLIFSIEVLRKMGV